jgi:hypothetical protein
MSAPSSMTVFIPLVVRKRYGHPRIVPPPDLVPSNDEGIDPRVLRAIARGWSWQRRLENGEASTIQDLADAERVTDRFVGRMIRLAWLSPAVLENLVLERCPSAVSIKDMIEAADLPWGEQDGRLFGGVGRPECAHSRHSGRWARMPKPGVHATGCAAGPESRQLWDFADSFQAPSGVWRLTASGRPKSGGGVALVTAHDHFSQSATGG